MAKKKKVVQRDLHLKVLIESGRGSELKGKVVPSKKSKKNKRLFRKRKHKGNYDQFLFWKKESGDNLYIIKSLLNEWFFMLKLKNEYSFF